MFILQSISCKISCEFSHNFYQSKQNNHSISFLSPNLNIETQGHHRHHQRVEIRRALFVLNLWSSNMTQISIYRKYNHRFLCIYEIFSLYLFLVLHIISIVVKSGHAYLYIKEIHLNNMGL